LPPGACSAPAAYKSNTSRIDQSGLRHCRQGDGCIEKSDEPLDFESAASMKRTGLSRRIAFEYERPSLIAELWPKPQFKRLRGIDEAEREWSSVNKNRVDQATVSRTFVRFTLAFFIETGIKDFASVNDFRVGVARSKVRMNESTQRDINSTSTRIRFKAAVT
jgi:hypothetical protein